MRNGIVVVGLAILAVVFGSMMRSCGEEPQPKPKSNSDPIAPLAAETAPGSPGSPKTVPSR